MKTLPGFGATHGHAFIAPGKTPKSILERWSQDLVKALKDVDVEDRTWGKVVTDRRITANRSHGDAPAGRGVSPPLRSRPAPRTGTR